MDAPPPTDNNRKIYFILENVNKEAPGDCRGHSLYCRSGSFA